MPHPLSSRLLAALFIVPAVASAGHAQENVERGTRVVPERPARVFVMAGFDQACKAKTPVTITVDKAPEKGSVSFREGQETTLQYSISGRCVGSRLIGTGIYYTANKGATGGDTFSVTARLGADTASRTFTVRIAED
jgi:hypothetical protein